MIPNSVEFRTYLRELPQLLDGGEDGRYALIRDDVLYGTWDTLRDALQAGYDRFGLDTPFATQPIHARDLPLALGMGSVTKPDLAATS